MLEFETKKSFDPSTGRRYVQYKWGNFAIEADAQGIKLTGFSDYVTTREELNDLAMFMGDAWGSYEALQPKDDLPVPNFKGEKNEVSKEAVSESPGEAAGNGEGSEQAGTTQVEG